MSDKPKPAASLVADARAELRHYLENAPGPALLVATEDYQKVKRLHDELLDYFRVRFSDDSAEWPVWARGAALPMQRVLIGARKRVEHELARERTRRNGEKTK